MRLALLMSEQCRRWPLRFHSNQLSTVPKQRSSLAAALAALGSCTGGSIRGPASHCGIVGLKATYGRVSRYGVVPLAWTLDHCGPLTWDVEDAAFMLQAIAGPDPRDPTASAAPVPDYAASLAGGVEGLRIGVPRHYFFSDDPRINRDTLVAAEAALGVLEGLGAIVEEVVVPMLEHVGAAHPVLMLSEAYAYHQQNLRDRPEDFGDMSRSRFLTGGLFTGGDYVQAQRVRSVLNREFANVLQRVDLIATPTMSNPPGRFDEVDLMGNSRRPSFTSPFNMTGMPAISVPCGFTPAGLPVGLQLAGKNFDEPTVLRAAYAYQQAAEWHERRPNI